MFSLGCFGFGHLPNFNYFVNNAITSDGDNNGSKTTSTASTSNNNGSKNTSTSSKGNNNGSKNTSTSSKGNNGSKKSSTSSKNNNNGSKKTPSANSSKKQSKNGSNHRRCGGKKMHVVYMPSGASPAIVIPSKWPCKCETVGENLKLYTLRPDGRTSAREYKIVMDEMHKTLKKNEYKSYSIKLIQKVENCCLWTKFRKREIEIFEEWGAKRVHERMLFHGSKSADDIVKTGFDLSKANAGYFGKGIYFASHSTKSNQYAESDSGPRKMLLVRVALGNMHLQTTTDTDITQPPSGYHSIRGIIEDFPEYIVYNEAQAYPEYLVHYDVVT